MRFFLSSPELAQALWPEGEEWMAQSHPPHRWTQWSLRVLREFDTRHPGLSKAVRAAMDEVAHDPYAIPGMREYIGGDVPGRAYIRDVAVDLDFLFGIMPRSRTLVLWEIRYWRDLAGP